MDRNTLVIIHRLDPNLLYRIDYFLMLYAKSFGHEVSTDALAAAAKAAKAAIADSKEAIDEGKPQT